MTKGKDFNNLKQWIEKYSKKAELPIYKLANRAGISRAAIYAWMNDTSRPDSETMLKVVRVIAECIGEDSAKLHAEALSHYVNRPEGRTLGVKVGPTGVRARH